MAAHAGAKTASSWPSITIASWQDFLSRVATILEKTPFPPILVFRGQSNEALGLVPSLHRLFPPNITLTQALKIEALLGREFLSQSHSLIPGELSHPLLKDNCLPYLWCMMQHHGAPTRLLDWTESPYVAAYFAVESDPTLNGAIYIAAPGPMNEEFGWPPHFDEAFNGLLQNGNTPDRTYFFYPTFKTERMIAQQGHFSFNANILSPQDSSLQVAFAQVAAKMKGSLVYQKWVIPATLKPEILRHLRLMNVAASVLFPGLDGIGRSLRDLARLQAGT